MRFQLRREHPKHATHVLVMRRRPVVPQLIGTFPPEPPADAPDDDRDVYAAWYLGTFYTDAVWDSLAEGETLWALLQRAPPLPATVARVMARVQAAAAARRERVARAQLRHADLRAAAADGGGGGGSSDEATDDGEGDDAAAALAAAEGRGASRAATVAEIMALLERQNAPDPSAAEEAQFKQAALKPLNTIKPADLRHLELPPTHTRSAWPENATARKKMLKGLKAAASAAKAFRGMLDVAPEAFAAAAAGARLRVRAPPSNPELVVLERETNGTWMQLERGTLPPFERCASVPDAADTAKLMGLDPYQTFSFRIIAQHLDATLAGEHPPQLRAIIQGQPGAGKSRMMWAFLWYAFQHNAADRVRVATYTWRAAKQVRRRDASRLLTWGTSQTHA
jgi:hypothetical protein